MGYKKIKLNVSTDNQAAYHLYKKVGFTVETEVCYLTTSN